MHHILKCSEHFTPLVQKRFTHGIDATELQCGEGNEDGEDLPAQCLAPNQLHHWVVSNTLQSSFLLQHLLHLNAVVLVAP